MNIQIRTCVSKRSIVNHRPKKLISNVEVVLKELLQECARGHHFTIEPREIIPDHYHVFVNVHP